MQSAINGFGMVGVAAWSAYVKIDSIVDVFVSALGSTVITFVGQNFGANKKDRVKKSVKQIIILSYIITITLMSVFVLSRFFLLGLFTDDSEVITIGANLFFVIMPMYLLGIPQTMCIQALRGLGKSLVPMILTLVGVIGIRVLWVVVIFPLNPTIYFLGACYPISACIMSVIFMWYYRYVAKQML
ncbi:MAG: MATE family efflux transporter [Clostridia bacterium]